MPRPSIRPLVLSAAAGLTISCTPAPSIVETVPSPAAVAPPSESAAFVVMLGADTMAVERFIRTPTTLEGDIVVRAPRTRVIHYSATLAPDGTIRRYESALRPGTALQGPATQQASISFAGDSAHITTVAGTNTRTSAIGARAGAVPISVVTYALFEQGALQHRRSGSDSTEVDFVIAGGRQAAPIRFVSRGTDSLLIYFRGNPLLASVDQAGRLTGIDGIRTTEKVQVRRVPSVDFDAIVASFVAREQQGGAVGQLSPRDTARATVGPATITVDYSRPSRRGREIFGRVVPWNQVWRTGANAATTLTTSAPLSIGGATVPAGSYTLFTLPAPGASQLIINRQTGQWGTVYDSAQDLARVAMIKETLPSPVEQFTIEIVPLGDGAQLRMAWDRTRFTVPISIP